jgi:predicted flap endonuclease-1-like 5' DNA nuclease
VSLASLIHIGEVAALLLVAYVVGCAIGYFARRLTMRRPAAVVDAVAIKPAEETPVAAAVAAEAATPAAPVEIVTATAEPQTATTAAPAPKISAIESLKSLSETMPLVPAAAAPAVPEPVAVAEPSPLPPVVPAKSTDPGVVTEMASFADATAAAKRMIEEALKPAAVAPIVPVKPVAVERPSIARPAPEAEAAPIMLDAPVAGPPAVLPEPPPADPEPAAVVVPPLPASLPGQAWAGEIQGHLAAASDAASAPNGGSLPSDPEPELPSVEDAVAAALIASIEQSITVIRPGERPPAAERPVVPELVRTVDAPVVLEPAAAEPVAALEPVTQIPDIAVEEPEVAPLPPLLEPAVVSSPLLEDPALSYPPPPEPVEFDEDAAMRDIEGGWSRRQTRAMSDTPELADVGAAVSAAQVAVEKILARNGVSADRQTAAGKPKGLSRPRNDRADNLSRINGLSGLDESTLNNLGVFHFDQVAAWDQKEVLWLENHAFARGRIGRETWQEQARALADASNPLRASR